MKSFLNAVFILLMIVVSSLKVFGQNKASFPRGLNQNSSVSEILTWLDHTSFRNARVVLKDSWDADTYRPPWDDTEPIKNTFIFTQGFRVTNIDGCNLSDQKKVRLLGAWRTEFTYNGWFSRTMVGLTLYSPEWKEPQHWEGMNLAFTFDTREMCEKFDAAFPQAIRLCRSK